MTKELRRLSIVMLFMFLALFGSTTFIQTVYAGPLEADPHNRRALYDSYEVQRGSIIAGGTVIASSVPSDDVYSWMRQYPDGPMWAPVTGYINPALGSSTGMENAANGVLSGTDNSQFLTRLERIVTGEPPRGSSVSLSIDPTVQRAAFDALGDYQGAVVAIEPKTGRILAMATSPSYDPNRLAAHDTAAVNTAYDEIVNDPLDPLYNRAIGGDLNPPASTFKLVVASAAFESGKYTPDSTFPNPATWTLPGTDSVLRNFDGGTCGPGDQVSIATALKFSCNIPFAQLAVELGDDAIRAEAEKYGFNRSFELPLISTASEFPRGLNAPETALSGIGQDNVRATPLQMAMVSAGIANDGVVMNPRMMDAVVAPDLTVQKQFDDSEFGRATSADVAEQLTTMMVANVDEGVATGARIDGVDVAGKTGTAEHGPGDPYTLWFTGFAPAEDPRVAVAVVIENGGGLGQAGRSNGIAAPIAKKVIEAVLNG